MGQVSITMNGRAYRLECDDGEEQHLLKLAGSVGEQIETLKVKFGQIGDERLMLMAGLMIADQLAETQRKLDGVKGNLDDVMENNASTDDMIRSAQEDMAVRVNAAAERIEALNAVLGAESAGLKH